MIWMIILAVILFGIIGYAGYRIWYLAGTLADAQEYIEELEVTNRYMYSRIMEAHDVMQRIDRLGAFESEDEAGTTFQLLNEVITELKETFDGEAQEEK
jgi:hypothetical protein